MKGLHATSTQPYRAGKCYCNTSTSRYTCVIDSWYWLGTIECPPAGNGAGHDHCTVPEVAGTGSHPAAHEQLARRPYPRGTGQRVQGPGHVAQGPGGGPHAEGGESSAELGAAGFRFNNRHHHGAPAQHHSQGLEADGPCHQRQGPGGVPGVEAKLPERVGAGPVKGQFHENV